MPINKALKQLFGRKKKSKKAKPSIKLLNVGTAELSNRNSRRSSPTIVVDIGSIAGVGTTPTIVCDLGSSRTRIGFANHRLPRVDTPSWVGHRPIQNNEFFPLADEGVQMRHSSSLLKPVRKGRIVNLKAATFLLGDGFRRLGVLTAEDLSGHNLLLALRPSESQKTSETLFETLMETYRPDGCYFAFQQPLALFACGRMTGCVLDSGAGVTHAVAVFCGQLVRGAVETVSLGGDDVTDALASCLAEKWDFRARSQKNRRAIELLKERLRLVSPKSARPPTQLLLEEFQLPNGKRVVLGDDRFACAEPLFNPHLVGQRGAGVGAAITLALRKMPIIERTEMAKNIFSVGGNSMLIGFDQRLRAELDRKYGENAVVRRLSSADKTTAAWRGGAAWARTPGFPDMLVTPAEYQEEGLRAFRRKCCLKIRLGDWNL